MVIWSPPPCTTNMSYAVEAWFGTYKKHTDKIFVLQKKVIRIINNPESLSHTSAHFKKLEILKLCDLHK